MSNSNYGFDFYKDRHKETAYSAKVILSLVLDALPEVNSAIDFGCGVGTWLSFLEEKGIEEVQGIDGPWVQQDLLEISANKFRGVNFEEKISLDRKYDLAITLEVAEHISEDKAILFVESLVSASDFIMFSAAIPLQGGIGHINERWPDYWITLFSDKGYVAFDFIRKIIWEDEKIPSWYRQNIFIFVKKELAEKVKVPKSNKVEGYWPMSLVHPELYLQKSSELSSLKDEISSVRGSLTLFKRAIKNRMSKYFRNE